MLSVNITSEQADKLLTARGWQVVRVRGEVHFVRPGGRRRADGGQYGKDYVWQRDEALMVALTDETDALPTPTQGEPR